MENPSFNQQLYILDNAEHTIENIRAFLVKVQNGQIDDSKAKIEEELAYTNQRRQLLREIRHISYSEYISTIQNDERLHYLIFFYDPSTDLDSKAFEMIVQL